VTEDISRRRALLLSLGGALGLALPTTLIAEDAEARLLRPLPPEPLRPPPPGRRVGRLPGQNVGNGGAARAISEVTSGAGRRPQQPRLLKQRLRRSRTSCGAREPRRRSEPKRPRGALSATCSGQTWRYGVKESRPIWSGSRARALSEVRGRCRPSGTLGIRLSGGRRNPRASSPKSRALHRPRCDFGRKTIRVRPAVVGSRFSMTVRM
jgi:hypothetical protein